MLPTGGNGARAFQFSERVIVGSTGRRNRNRRIREKGDGAKTGPRAREKDARAQGGRSRGPH